MAEYKKYNVTFTEKTKYNPMTRTIMVEALDETHAANLIHNLYGSFKYDKELLQYTPTDKKIKIDKVEDFIEEEGEK